MLPQWEPTLKNGSKGNWSKSSTKDNRKLPRFQHPSTTSMKRQPQKNSKRAHMYHHCKSTDSILLCLSTHLFHFFLIEMCSETLIPFNLFFKLLFLQVLHFIFFLQLCFLYIFFLWSAGAPIPVYMTNTFKFPGICNRQYYFLIYFK